MTGKGSIVVGCDGQPTSDDAIRFAAEEARVRGARLLVVCAYYRPIDPDLTDFDLPEPVLGARAVRKAELAVRRALGLEAHAALDAIEFVAAEGEPARVLESYARDAVMIVIGSHERPVLGRLLHPGTRGHLLHGYEVPVTVVPPVHA
jgi:nucleotide-binding universal stress UspA family protein